jgi:subtilisin family serine protease
MASLPHDAGLLDLDQPTPPAVPPRVRETSKLAFDPVKFADPELQAPWHLGMLGDMEAVWADYTGKGVHVGVYDSGIEKSHWDLADNYDASRHVVVDGKSYDGMWSPQSGDAAHGTAVAGLIAAQRNGRGGVGVSYDAKVTGVNIFDPYSDDGVAPGIYINSDDLTKFVAAFDQGSRFDVVNHSWGGRFGYSTDTSRLTEGTIFNILAGSLENAATVGRDGLGTVSVTASGNFTNFAFGGTHEQSDSWKSDRHIITVGAYRGDNGSTAFYSAAGPHLLVSAPSWDLPFMDDDKGIVTTDLLGYWGYNKRATPGAKDDYTDGFSGTSASTPIVSGIVSLMLDANEGLGWRDVSNILAASAKMPVAFETGPTSVITSAEGLYSFVVPKGWEASLNDSRFKLGGASAEWNGGRMHYSTDYGYGAADAYTAVRMAEVWSLFGGPKTSGTEVSVDSGKMPLDLKVPIYRPEPEPDNPYADQWKKVVGSGFVSDNPAAITLEMASNIAIEHVDLTLEVLTRLVYPDWEGGPDIVEYTMMHGLRFRVTAPDGTSAFMDTYGSKEGSVEGVQEFTFGLAAFRGVDSAGIWKIEFEVLDGVTSPETTIKGLRLQAFGGTVNANDVHSYTNEFFTMAAIAGEDGRKMLADAAGVDWINAAAVSGDVALSLVEGATTRFGGRDAFTIARGTQIENAVTGDGDDRLFGNAVDNRLYGMRGDDWLNGGAGDDTLFGGTGSDVFAFDTAGASGRDRVLDWGAGDRIATSKQLRGADQNGLLTVGSSALLLLDNSTRGDAAELDGMGGAVLQALGRVDGYWWYGFVSGGDEDFVDGRVTELALGQTGRPAGILSVDAAVAGGPGASSPAHGVSNTAFFLYDAMGDAMASGVQTYA